MKKSTYLSLIAVIVAIIIAFAASTTPKATLHRGNTPGKIALMDTGVNEEYRCVFIYFDGQRCGNTNYGGCHPYCYLHCGGY